MKPASLLLYCALLPSLAAQENPPTQAPAPAVTPAPAPAATTPAPAPATSEVVTLEPFKVHGSASSNFAVSVRISVNPDTNKTQIIITKVYPFSDASRLGLEPGDEIVKINGAPVADMDPKVGAETPLGKLLLNRKSGDGLDLQVAMHRIRSLTLRAGGMMHAN